MPRTIIISIINFELFGCDEFHSEFQPLEVRRHELLSDKMIFHFFELTKLPKEIADKNMLLLWLSLFRAETQEELEKIKALEVPVMNQAIDAYYTITASSEFRERERLRAKARHDEAQALSNAERAKAMSIARNALNMGMDHDTIIKLTNLTLDDMKGLME